MPALRRPAMNRAQQSYSTSAVEKRETTHTASTVRTQPPPRQYAALSRTGCRAPLAVEERQGAAGGATAPRAAGHAVKPSGNALRNTSAAESDNWAGTTRSSQAGRNKILPKPALVARLGRRLRLLHPRPLPVALRLFPPPGPAVVTRAIHPAGPPAAPTSGRHATFRAAIARLRMRRHEWPFATFEQAQPPTGSWRADARLSPLHVGAF